MKFKNWGFINKNVFEINKSFIIFENQKIGNFETKIFLKLKKLKINKSIIIIVEIEKLIKVLL